MLASSPHTPTVSKGSGLFCAVKSPRCLLVCASSMGAAEPNPESLPQLFVSNTSKPAKLVIALVSSRQSKRPTGCRTRCSSVGAQGRQNPVLFVRAFHRHFSSTGRLGGDGGALMYLRRLPPRMSVFCLAAVTEKRHISTRSVSFHTHFLSQTHTQADGAICSPGLRIFSSLSLSAGKC